MIAGVLLGPSLFGLLAPEWQKHVFTPENKGVLYVGAQFGVGLYMFMVGTSFQAGHFKAKAKSAMSVSFAGIAAPFIIAALITPFLLKVPGLFADGISQSNATLFMGACIALTAFPMLARIINERGLAKTSLGTLSLTAGAFDDAVSWCVLALVLATFGGGPGVAGLAIGGGLLWVLFVTTLGPKILAPLGRMVERDGEMTTSTLALVILAFCVSAFLMDAVGIHAIFGGFILGVVMPRGLLVDSLWDGWFETAQALGCSAVITNYALMDRALVERLHGAGLKAVVYTVNDPAAAQWLIANGVDGIISDAVDRFSPA